MKTKLLIIIGLIISIIISVSALIIIDNIELDSTTHLQRILDNCYAQKNNLTHTQPHMTTTNGTHFIDNGDCKWEIIETIEINMPICENNRNDIQQVLDHCNTPFRDSSYYYSNETHSINTFTCEWREHENFPNTDNLCIPYIFKWVNEEIRNQTHIFDQHSCTWKIDENHDIVNSKGCPQFCPKDDTPEKIDGMQEIIIDENKGGNDYGIQSNFDSIFEYTHPDESLNSVFRSCERWENARAVNFTSPDGTKFRMTTVGYTWNNSTHYIDNHICDFIPMKKHIEDSLIGAILEYCGSSHKLSYDNPYEYWFANETHYIDSDICLWQSLDDDIALVLPDSWENVYHE